ncbi:MAG: AmmeMemoRadiSam system protein A [Candidatus Moranbacteria bacterium]|nr:AmmeMemoRadiSam system protein A [Candidatus Moranbacteria bacterium]
MNHYLKLAKNTAKKYLENGEILKPDWEELPKQFKQFQAGVFVSIYNENQLRACIGTIEPQRENLALEIIHNTVAALTQDFRFRAIEKNEVSDLKFEVSVLSKPELINSYKELDPKKYGVIVKNNTGQTGVLLPELQGITTVREQIETAATKAGIDPESQDLEIYRFWVEKHKQ